VAVKLARAKVALQTTMKTTSRRKRGMGRREFLKQRTAGVGRKKPRGGFRTAEENYKMSEGLERAL
jgi:hypothetical protein